MKKGWSIKQKDFHSDANAGSMESLFTLGNGFLGIRGDFPLSGKVVEKGTFINGFYESGRITYGEKAYGYADNWQTIVPLPEAKELNIEVDGQVLFSSSGQFKVRQRLLNLEESLIRWEVLWCDNRDREYKCEITLVIPFHYRGVLQFLWKITMPEKQSSIKISSPISMVTGQKEETDDPRLPGHFDGSTLSIASNHLDGKYCHMTVEAEGSSLWASVLSHNQVSGIDREQRSIEKRTDGITEIIEGRADTLIEIVKTVSYDYGPTSQSDNVKRNNKASLERAVNEGHSSIVEKQRQFMRDFWKRSDISIEGDEDAQLSLRYNLFQLLQSTGRDGERSIAAKGLSGSGYEGHYFWDAETYVLPFFIYTNPSIARSMLKYRISRLQQAGERAEMMHQKGVLFPWRTINGEECSAYFPAGTAQYHINSDIALGLNKYLEATGDLSILDEGGDSLLEGTARFWADLGTMVEGKGFCFHSVTGPDEYTALVDNNYYTNLSARENLKAAARWLVNRVSTEDISLWNSLAELVYLPENGSVTPQDDTFLEKEKWDFAGTDESSYPLLLHFHPLNIYRKQVLKQADVIMAQVLFPTELPFDQKKLNFDYYEQITTRDSSLSACAQGICAFQLGYEDLAEEYFNETLHTDRKDLHGNVSHGLHTASMGGSYLMVLYGFLGLIQSREGLSFHPALPEKLNRLSLRVTLGSCLLEIVIGKENILYRSLEGELSFYHFDELMKLSEGQEIDLPLRQREKKDFTLFRPRT